VVSSVKFLVPGWKKANRRQRGFTLIEVLLALTIFSFSVMGIALALDKTMDMSLLSRRHVRIRHELETRMAELRGKTLVIGPATLDPDLEGTAYDTEVIQEDLKDGTGNGLNGIFRLVVHARWKEAGESREDAVEMYVLQ
jgi:prepilin-type N-terminal cleavage/methylation domain-containing protein